MLAKVERTDAVNSGLVTHSDKSSSILKDPLHEIYSKNKDTHAAGRVNGSFSACSTKVYSTERTSSDLTFDKSSHNSDTTSPAEKYHGNIGLKNLIKHSIVESTKDSEELKEFDNTYKKAVEIKHGYNFARKIFGHEKETKGLGKLAEKRYQAPKNIKKLQQAIQMMKRQETSRAILKSRTSTVSGKSVSNAVASEKVAKVSVITKKSARSIAMAGSSSGSLITACGIVIGVILAIILAIVIFASFISMISEISNYSNSNTDSLAGNEKIVAQFLLDKGLDPLHVAAIMGNIEAESSFNPALIEAGNGIGFGLCQWSFVRRTQLEKYVISKGKSSSDIYIQLDFLWAELTGIGDAVNYTSIQYDHAGFLKVDNLENAVYYFGRNFERPLESAAHWDRRIASAQRYYSTLIYTSGFNDVLAIADAQLGKPYVWGAAGPDAFDCSGLVYYCYYHAGIYTGERTTAEGYRQIATPITATQAKPGDLVFWISSGGVAEHIAIYVGDGRVIHSPQTGEVIKYSNIWYQENISVIYGRIPPNTKMRR